MARTITMRRNSKGRFVATAKSSSKKKHHHKARPLANYMSIAPAFNPPKKHAKRRKHAAQHNPPRRRSSGMKMPSLAGIELPGIPTTLGVVGGLAGPSLIRGAVTKAFPTMAAQNPTVLSIVSYVVPPVAGYVIDGKRGAKNVLLGEAAAYGAKLLVQAVGSMVSGVVPAGGGIGGYLSPTRRAQLGNRNISGYLPPTARGQMSGVTAFQNRTSRFKSRF